MENSLYPIIENYLIERLINLWLKIVNMGGGVSHVILLVLLFSPHHHPVIKKRKN